MRPSDPKFQAFLAELTELSRKHNLVVGYDGTVCELTSDAKLCKGSCAYTLDQDDHTLTWEELPAVDQVCEVSNYQPVQEDSSPVEILMLPRAS